MSSSLLSRTDAATSQKLQHPSDAIPDLTSLTCCEQVNGPGGATSTHAKEDVPDVGLLGELGVETGVAPGLECDAMPMVVVLGGVAVVGAGVVGVPPGGVVAVELVGVALEGVVAVGVVGGAPGDVADPGGGLEGVLMGEG
ncbi:hypothetical protein WJX77_010372 [Trebouxia sp. C0004]